VAFEWRWNATEFEGSLADLEVGWDNLDLHETPLGKLTSMQGFVRNCIVKE